MRVKLIIAFAMASLFILVNALPAGAVEGVTGVSSTAVTVGTPVIVPPVVPTFTTPGTTTVFTAPVATTFGPITPITLGGPALAVAITLSPPQVPSFISPTFVLPSTIGPSIGPFIARAPAFDP